MAKVAESTPTLALDAPVGSAAPPQAEAVAPPRRYAQYVGPGSGFQIGDKLNVYRGDVIEITPADTRVWSDLIAPRTERPMWLEFPAESVAYLHFCPNCRTYRHPNSEAGHFQRVQHEGPVADPLQIEHLEWQVRFSKHKALETQHRAERSRAEGELSDLTAKLAAAGLEPLPLPPEEEAPAAEPERLSAQIGDITYPRMSDKGTRAGQRVMGRPGMGIYERDPNQPQEVFRIRRSDGLDDMVNDR